MGIKARVGGYDGSGWAFLGEHANQDKICVVNPVELLVGGGIEAIFVEEVETLLAEF